MPDDLAVSPFREDRVIFGRVVEWKTALLSRAWTNFQAKRDNVLRDALGRVLATITLAGAISACSWP